MRSVLLVADAEGAAAVPEPVREQWDQLEWVCETTGTAALARVRTGVRPVLAIVNLQLPDMCGTELVERLRKGLPGLAVIVISNTGGKLAERIARSLGVIAYLDKPVDASLADQIFASLFREVAGARERRVGLDTVGGE